MNNNLIQPFRNGRLLSDQVRNRGYRYILLTLCLIVPLSLSANEIPLRHAISLYGEPKYPASFKHFDYVNPNAPKGGVLKHAAVGQFDSLIPYRDKGIPAAGSHLQYDTLLQRSWDEPLSKYGLIAEKIELDPAHQWVAFHVNPSAHFNDGVPVTAKDVKFSFDLLREKGSTFYRHFYRDIDRVEVTSSHRAVFYFKQPDNRELPLILGQMPILPEHYWRDRDFNEHGLSVPVTSGPYKVARVQPGRSITYERVKNYWAKDLPVMSGRHNFDEITYEYYIDATVSLEGLFKREYDISVISDWMMKSGHMTEDSLVRNDLRKSVFQNGNPQTLTLTYNTRHRFLKSPKVRESIGYAMDFESINENQFMGIYKRADSFFAGTDLASASIPDAMESKWLKPWASQLPAKLFTEPYELPQSRIGVGDRLKRAKALKLLKQAGWRIRENQQVNKNNEPLELVALVSSAEQEKILLSLKRGLKYLGIHLNVDRVDPLQYVERIRELDFDIILHTYPHTPSPGTEQASLWGSGTSQQRGTRNLTGINSPVVDDLVAKIPKAQSRKELLSVIHALDRVLLWEQVALPLWYLPTWTVVHDKALKAPQHPAPYALDLSTWWFDQKH